MQRRSIRKEVLVLITVATLIVMFASFFPDFYSVGLIVYLLCMVVALGLVFKEKAGIKSASLSVIIVAAIVALTLIAASFISSRVGK